MVFFNIRICIIMPYWPIVSQFQIYSILFCFLMLKLRTLQMPSLLCCLAFYYILLIKGTWDRMESNERDRNFVFVCLLQSITFPEFQQLITVSSIFWHTQTQPPRVHTLPMWSEPDNEPEFQLLCSSGLWVKAALYS